MTTVHRKPTKRAYVALIMTIIVLALILLAALRSCAPSVKSYVMSLCAVEASDSCSLTSTLQVNGTQVLRASVTETDTTPHVPVSGVAVTFHIVGTHVGERQATTGHDGTAEISYSGGTAGGDAVTVSAVLAPGMKVQGGSTATVTWTKPDGFSHPLIFLHGVNENANDIAQHAEWAALFGQLASTYDLSDIEAFCYVDDQAYADSLGYPPECPGPKQACDTMPCISQSAVLDNAQELARWVTRLYADPQHNPQHRPVTLIGYSMGTAIIRTMLAGCLSRSGSPADQSCATAANEVDSVFFLNGVQQGSWLLTARQRFFDTANPAQTGMPQVVNSAYASLMGLIGAAVDQQISARMGLNAKSPGVTDLTPRSDNIIAHNSVPIPDHIKVYTFYGAIALTTRVKDMVYVLGPGQPGYPAEGVTPLPLGDLALLAQDNTESGLPLWGGAALCDGCGSAVVAKVSQPGPAPIYQSAGDQFHAWALVDVISVDPADLVTHIGPTFQDVLNSPVNHLQITAQTPGSSNEVMVPDMNAPTGPQVPMSVEILNILKRADGLG